MQLHNEVEELILIKKTMLLVLFSLSLFLENIQEYKGPRKADGIVTYLEEQNSPASAEIKSVEDAANLFGEDNIFIVGIFPELIREEFDNFTGLAKKLRSDYDFGHTLDAKILPRGGESSVDRPTVRLLKPFDELFVDLQDFHVDALEKFVEEASVPIVTLFNKDPSNHPFVIMDIYSMNFDALMDELTFRTDSGLKFGWFFLVYLIFYFIGFAFFCVESLLSIWVIQQVDMYFRGSGKAAEMKRDAARGTMRAALTLIKC